MTESAVFDVALRKATEYSTLAEREKNKALEYKKQLDGCMKNLDNLRRSMVFINKGHDDILDLASIITEINRLKELSLLSNSRLNTFIVGAVSSIASVYELSLTDVEKMPFVQMGNIIRSISVTLRETKSLYYDRSSIISLALRIEIYLLSKVYQRSMISHLYFQKQIKDMISILS